MWTAAPQRRLAALNVLAQLPVDTALSSSIAYAVLRSCLDTEAGVAAAALRCGRLHVAIQAVPTAESGTWFKTLVRRLNVGETTDCQKGNIALAISNLSQIPEGRRALVAAGACEAAADALRSAASDDAKASISLARLAGDDDVPRSLSSAP